jgi:Zn-dependent M28 family amino/carboxypeptidase
VQTLASWDRSSYGTTELDAARDWIAMQFSALGLSDGLQAFTMNGAGGGTITRYNVSGAWIGSSQPDRWLIVGAHYDSRNASASSTVNTPGAEDNASGCAGVIELARALLPSSPSHSILFMCYAGEEQGLRGSAAHVQSLIQAGQLLSVDAVVIMDMIGYSADANLQALYESSASYSPYLLQFGAAAANYVPQLAVITSTNPFGSDHVPYLNAGVRTALAIENDWDIYPHYHRSTDTPGNMGPNAQPMGAAILKTNAAVIAEIAGLDIDATPLFDNGFEAQ